MKVYYSTTNLLYSSMCQRNIYCKHYSYRVCFNLLLLSGFDAGWGTALLTDVIIVCCIKPLMYFNHMSGIHFMRTAIIWWVFIKVHSLFHILFWVFTFLTVFQQMMLQLGAGPSALLSQNREQRQSRTRCDWSASVTQNSSDISTQTRFTLWRL